MQDDIQERAVLLLLHSDALWAEEYRCHLPKADGYGGDLTGEGSARH